MFLYVVDVSFTVQRPIIPDQYTSRVTLLAESDYDAHLTACYMVEGRPGVVMATRSRIESVVL